MKEETALTTELIQSLQIMAQRLRRHAAISTSRAGSGHPSSCFSCAELVSTLFFRFLRCDVNNPAHPLNDRFILSKGHAAPILWAAWAEAGAFPVDRLLTLRQIDSDLEGHPTPRNPWVDVATGSLGQGLSVGVGMAFAARLSRLPNRIFVLLGDGESAEGSVWEAAALASYYGLDNLVAILDTNAFGQSQKTMVGHSVEEFERRFQAFGWKTRVIDGHDIEQIIGALDGATQSQGAPAVIIARTLKGKGVSFMENRDGWHGKPLQQGKELEKALAEIGDSPPLPQPLQVAPVPDFAVADLPGTPPSLPPPQYAEGQQVATREAYGNALRKLGAVHPNLVALDGDTKNSTYSERFLKEHPERFIECFIAEQNMVGVAVGLAALGKIPFASTFACFLCRAYDHIRMAGISRANIKLCGSHAGVSIGEDGPSQMGLEDLAMMRAIAGSTVFYPCDAVSAERLVALAAETPGVVYIRTSRPKTPVIYSSQEAFRAGGSKVLRSGPADRATLVAAGVTVHEALRAHAELLREDLPVRVIDLYSVKPVDAETLRKAAAETGLIITVEDHYREGGLGDAVLDAVANTPCRFTKLAVSDLPRSGKPAELMDLFGISAPRIVQTVREILNSKF